MKLPERETFDTESEAEERAEQIIRDTMHRPIGEKRIKSTAVVCLFDAWHKANGQSENKWAVETEIHGDGDLA